MQRVLAFSAKRLYSSSSVRRAEAASTGAASLVLNFATPYTPIITKKVVDKVILPGESGDYGVTAAHSPLISQLKPGVVSVIHVNGDVEKFFIPGGFALTHADSVTDVSVPEAYPLSEFDSAFVQASYTAAVKEVESSEGAAKATAQIQLSVYSSLARAIGLTV